MSDRPRTPDAGRRDGALLDGEPPAGPWRTVPVTELAEQILAGTDHPGRPLLVAVDGRGGSGKSTISASLRAAVLGADVVATDDVAWHHSAFDWADLLAERVLEPVRAGRAVRWQPQAWRERGRAGAIEVPAGCELVLVEGTGAGRRRLSGLLDAVVWVQSDAHEAERLGIARDIAAGVNGDAAAATAFWYGWMAEERPFLAEDRPWERAAVVVAGTGLAAPGGEAVTIAAAPHGSRNATR